MKIFTFKDFMKKYNLKDDTMNESELQRIYINAINPRDSKINVDKGFVNIDDSSQGGTHWTSFIIKKITNHTTSIVSENLLIKIYKSKCLNQ